MFARQYALTSAQKSDFTGPLGIWHAIEQNGPQHGTIGSLFVLCPIKHLAKKQRINKELCEVMGGMRAYTSVCVNACACFEGNAFGNCILNAFALLVLVSSEPLRAKRHQLQPTKCARFL